MVKQRTMKMITNYFWQQGFAAGRKIPMKDNPSLPICSDAVLDPEESGVKRLHSWKSILKAVEDMIDFENAPVTCGCGSKRKRNSYIMNNGVSVESAARKSLLYHNNDCGGSAEYWIRLPMSVMVMEGSQGRHCRKIITEAVYSGILGVLNENSKIVHNPYNMDSQSVDSWAREMHTPTKDHGENPDYWDDIPLAVRLMEGYQGRFCRKIITEAVNCGKLGRLNEHSKIVSDPVDE